MSISLSASSLPFLPRSKSGFFISAHHDTLRPADCERRNHKLTAVVSASLADATRCSAHAATADECPLSGVKRTSFGHDVLSANDPKRTFRTLGQSRSLRAGRGPRLGSLGLDLLFGCRRR